MKEIKLGVTSLKIPVMALRIMQMASKTSKEVATAIETAFNELKKQDPTLIRN